MHIFRSGCPTWLVSPRRLRPIDFAMPPAPHRGMALETTMQLVDKLNTQGAVDGATGDVLDQLINSWLVQWRQQLEPEVTARQAALQRLIGLAQNKVATARGRANATQRAHDGAQAAYALTTSTTITSEKQVSRNGIRSSASH